MQDEDAVHEISTIALVREITSKTTELVRKEVELAVSEARADLRRELAMVKVMAGAAVGGIATVTLLLTALAFALPPVLLPWGWLLIVAGAVGVGSALTAWMGWRLRVSRPLEKTRKTVEEDVSWAKRQVA